MEGLKENSELEKISFGEGLFLMATRGNTIKPVRLNKAMKQIILTLIQENKERTSTKFEEDDEVGLGRFLMAMEYLSQQVGEGNHLNRIKLDKAIAWQLSCLVWDNEFHWLSAENEKEFEKAMQWIMYKIDKKYSAFEVAQWSAEEK